MGIRNLSLALGNLCLALNQYHVSRSYVHPTLNQCWMLKVFVENTGSVSLHLMGWQPWRASHYIAYCSCFSPSSSHEKKFKCIQFPLYTQMCRARFKETSLHAFLKFLLFFFSLFTFFYEVECHSSPSPHLQSMGWRCFGVPLSPKPAAVYKFH